jgi:alkylation response protein AidB-like acyl-CoA dehydrogenase
VVDAVLEGAATLCEEVLAPINLSGDREGCHFKAGEVTTPAGFKEAYRQFVEGGWQGLSFPTEYGGQGLPTSISLFKTEMMGAANWSFNMYPGLEPGLYQHLVAIRHRGTKITLSAGARQRRVDRHHVPDRAAVRHRPGADQDQGRAQPDGSYKLTGTKMFISAGEHDLAGNIVHVVLARLPTHRPAHAVFRYSWCRSFLSLKTALPANAIPSVAARSNTRWEFAARRPPC